MATRTNITNGSAHAGARTGRLEAARAALDVMLTDAAVSQGRVSRFVDRVSTAKLAAVLARRPQVVARRVGGLGAELGRIATGSSELARAKRDRRFADRAWNESWMFRRLMQAYLALGGTVEALIDDADLDWQAESPARFTLSKVLDAVAPTNLPLTNPTVLKETIDRGGANLVHGGRRMVRDVSKGRLPAMVDTSKFEVGGNLALTTGSVVLPTRTRCSRHGRRRQRSRATRRYT